MMFRRQRSIRAGRMEYAGVTPGTHEVRVRFGDTLPRQIGWGLSACAMLGWLGLVAWRQQAVPAAEDAAAQAPLWLAIALGGLVVVALGARAAADPYSWWRVKPAKMETPTAQYQLLAQLEGGIALVAYDLPRTSAKPGGSFPVMLYWEAVAPATRNLRSFVHLLGPDGKLWGQSDHFHPGGIQILATSRWPVYRPVSDLYEVALDPSVPPGVYTLRVGLWDRMTGERMRVLDANSQPTDQDGVVLTEDFSVTNTP